MGFHVALYDSFDNLLWKRENLWGVNGIKEKGKRLFDNLRSATKKLSKVIDYFQLLLRIITPYDLSGVLTYYPLVFGIIL